MEKEALPYPLSVDEMVRWKVYVWNGHGHKLMSMGGSQLLKFFVVLSPCYPEGSSFYMEWMNIFENECQHSRDFRLQTRGW